MTVTTHAIRPYDAETKAVKLAQYAEHSRAGLTDGCNAKGCRDRHPCWCRRDAYHYLRSAGRTDLELL